VRHKDEEKDKEKGEGKDKGKEVESTRKKLCDSIKIESGDKSKDEVNVHSSKSINDDNKKNNAKLSNSNKNKQKKKKKSQSVSITYENIINNKLMYI
jgi:hypothetical protein